ncbi:hypothetical protein EP7_001120 [Isosphaeraceae bacterium EP7]
MIEFALRKAPRRVARGVSVLLASLALACGPAVPARPIVSPPKGWTPIGAKSKPLIAPGRMIAGWDGPGGSSLCVYSTLPIARPDPEALVVELATRLTNMPGLTVSRREVVKLGSTSAAMVEVTAPGDGRSLAPTGLGKPKFGDDRPQRPTRQRTYTIPAPGQTIVLAWHSPAELAASIEPDLAATLATLRLPSSTATTSSSSSTSY